MKTILNYLLARLLEPSTWLGVAIGASTTAQALQSHIGLGAAIAAGFIAMALPEKGKYK